MHAVIQIWVANKITIFRDLILLAHLNAAYDAKLNTSTFFSKISQTIFFFLFTKGALKRSENPIKSLNICKKCHAICLLFLFTFI